jgi:hypothetical protein
VGRYKALHVINRPMLPVVFQRTKYVVGRMSLTTSRRQPISRLVNVAHYPALPSYPENPESDKKITPSQTTYVFLHQTDVNNVHTLKHQNKYIIKLITRAEIEQEKHPCPPQKQASNPRPACTLFS